MTQERAHAERWVATERRQPTVVTPNAVGELARQRSHAASSRRPGAVAQVLLPFSSVITLGEGIPRAQVRRARRARGAVAIEYLVAVLTASLLAGAAVRIVAPLVVGEYVRRQALLYSVKP